MNPTTSFLIKLSILISLSLQVATSPFPFVDNALDKIHNTMSHLTNSRRRLGRRQAGEVVPAVNPQVPAVTNITPDVANPKAAKGKEEPDSTSGENANSKKPTSKLGKGSKEEQLAAKVFEALIQMGGGLEIATNLGSTKEQIVESSKLVQQVISKYSTSVKELISTAPKESEKLGDSFKAASEAGEELIKSLKVIEEKGDDANIIKEQYQTLQKAFKQMVSTAETVLTATVPALAELAKKEGAVDEDKKVPNQKDGPEPQSAKKNDAELKLVSQKEVEQKPEGKKVGETTGGNKAEPEAAESTSKVPELANQEGVKPQAAVIEPILPPLPGAISQQQ